MKKKRKKISEAARKSRRAKAKGRRLQKWVTRKVSKVTGIPWGKDKLIASREMGQSGSDVSLRGKARKAFPLAIECKNREVWEILSWAEECEKKVEKDMKGWLLFVKKNNIKPLVILDAELFFKIWAGNVQRKNICKTTKRCSRADN